MNSKYLTVENQLNSHFRWERFFQTKEWILLNFQLNGSIRPVPPPRDHLRMEKDGRMVNRAPAPQVPDRNPALQSHQIAQIVDATPEQLDSIKKYQVNLVWIHYSRFFWFQIKMQPKMLCLVLKRENCHRYFHLWSSQSVNNQRQMKTYITDSPTR